MIPPSLHHALGTPNFRAFVIYESCLVLLALGFFVYVILTVKLKRPTPPMPDCAILTDHEVMEPCPKSIYGEGCHHMPPSVMLMRSPVSVPPACMVCGKELSTWVRRRESDRKNNPHLYPTMTPAQINAKRIQNLEAMRVQLWSNIESIAKENIPDYHFLDFKVSTFWTCQHSPIGMCVFKIEEDSRRMPQITVCRYCGGPVERK